MDANAKWLCAVVEARAFTTFNELYEYVEAREPNWSTRYVEKIIRYTRKKENYSKEHGISPIYCNIRTGIWETALGCDELLEAHAERKTLIARGNVESDADNAELTKESEFFSQREGTVDRLHTHQQHLIQRYTEATK